jgi:hypothetical protein
MWQKKIKKTIFTLNIGNYAPEIRELSYPLLKKFAHKIDADFYEITERKYPDFPPVYEKFQLYDLAQQMENDWNWYIDADTLVHPDMPDLTTLFNKDTVYHHGIDHAAVRYREDRFFLRYGRHISPGNWFTVASDWCIEVWKPLDDMTLEEAVQFIQPTIGEIKSDVIQPSHLIDDWLCARNVAKYGLKCVIIRETTFTDRNIKPTEGPIWVSAGAPPNGGPGTVMGGYLAHWYTDPIPVKVQNMKRQLSLWGVI